MNSLEMSSDAQQELRSVAQRVALVARPLDALTNSLSPELAPEDWFPAASVIKIGIMSALLEEVEKGRRGLADRLTLGSDEIVGGAGILFELEPGRSFSLAELCRLMMVISDNTASNALARLLGMDHLNDFFSRRGYQAEMKRFFMHPVKDDQDNRMTALAAVQMLADLYRGRELTAELRDFAVGCLRRQQYREKLPLMLPSEIQIGHKTGELDGVRHDAAVVELSRPYAIAVFTAQGAEPWVVDQAMARVSLEIYQNEVNL